jgi:hypothetical protein
VVRLLFGVLKQGVEATVDAAIAKAAARFCPTRRHKKEIAELNVRYTQLNEDVERGRLDQGILGEAKWRPREGPANVRRSACRQRRTISKL